MMWRNLSMLADENDDLKSNAGDPGDTMSMGSTESAGANLEPPKEKGPGDWVTVEMPKAPRPTSTPPASPPPAPAQSDAERTVLEGAGSTPKVDPVPPPAYSPA